MQTVKYNKYINLVGIEFEGLWRKTRFYRGYDLEDYHWPSFILEAKGDSSIEYQDFDADDFIDGEVVTKPLNESQLNKCLEWINRAYTRGDYGLNSSTGLHFHVSLNKNYYPIIDNPKFYDEFCQTFKETDPKCYQNRRFGSFCTERLTARYFNTASHFTLSSECRYMFVNYCHKKHGTVEFRAYGGEYATIEGLAKLINATLALIKTHIESSPKERINTLIERPKGEVKSLRYSDNAHFETNYQKIKSLSL